MCIYHKFPLWKGLIQYKELKNWHEKFSNKKSLKIAPIIWYNKDKKKI